MKMLKQSSITALLRGYFDIGGPFLGFSSMLLLIMLIQYGKSSNYTVLLPINNFNTKLLCLWYKTWQKMSGDDFPKFRLLAGLLLYSLLNITRYTYLKDSTVLHVVLIKYGFQDNF